MAKLREKPKKPWPPISTGNHALDQAINSEIALFNNTQNVFAFWAMIARCLSENIPFSDDAREELQKIAAELAEVGRKGMAGGRAEIADIILNTKNDSGGASQFEEYAAHKRRAAIVARARELIIADQRASVARQAKRSPQTKCYEIIATEFKVEPETVKRYVEEDDPKAGSFALKVLRGPGGDV